MPPSTPPASQLSRDVLAADWSKSQARAGLVLVIAIGGALAAGILTGNPRSGVLIAAGAFSVGFGSFQQLCRSRIVPMLLAAAGMCVSSWVGTLAGLSSITAVIASAAAAFLYAEISRRSQAASWVALQCAIWLVISTAYPVHGLPALNRGWLILTGGLLQATVTALVRRIAGARIPEWSGIQPGAPTQRISAIHATLAIAIAAALCQSLSAGAGSQNAYWMPMTTLIVLRSKLGQTVQRGVARTLGTMVGASLTTVIVTAAPPGQWVLALALFCLRGQVTRC
ncbi:MAG: FUSC family protein [Bryobacteraceae bacterium]